MLGSTQGHLTDRVTQRWVQFTGKPIDLERDKWLEGPIGDPSGIGKDYFQKLALSRGWNIRQNSANSGLLPNLDLLQSSSFDPGKVSVEVRQFYQRTGNYELDAWSEWCGAFRPFGFLLSLLFSRRLQQLNVPLNPLDTSRGMSSNILQLVDGTGDVHLTAWLRELTGTGHVLYAGAYSTCRVPRYNGVCVKVVFPLPNGNAIVIMRPVAHGDGSLSVISSGSGFGDSGFYFTVHSTRGIRARYVRAMRETIHVYRGENETVRADHVLTLGGARFLRLHYRLRLKSHFGIPQKQKQHS